MNSHRPGHAWVLCAVAAGLVGLSASLRAEDLTTRQLRTLMQENFDACNHESLERLLGTMSQEMPQRELFIQQTKAEWAASDLYYRLDGIKVTKQAKWRPPYIVATVTQTITGNEGKTKNPGLSNVMSLNTDLPTTVYEVLFKRERGKWKVVAGLTEPRPVGSQAVKDAVTSGTCADGSCRWPRRPQ
jgi:hypothetical protein